ncbi:hypothetical protein HK097_007651 [Rhizophlyctis rosea]|uniref:Protein kinase domain-containing protein n=1 Tax=Rhizophlyctis rosea TaxID=64517 RepID=A0AAD5SBC3_9FUNG|nr:hypothetical protein HK097_007651 [Rhizophlyctis rosea]
MTYPLKLGTEDDFISLPTPPASPTVISPITPTSPTQIGNYRILSLLGNGTFGAVHRAVDKRSTIDRRTGKQRVVAVKFVRKGQVTRAGLLEEQLLRHEAATLQRIHNDVDERLAVDGTTAWTGEREQIARSRIVSLLDVVDTNEYFATVMELAEGGELHDRLIAPEREEEETSLGSAVQSHGLDESLAKKIFMELAQGKP